MKKMIVIILIIILIGLYFSFNKSSLKQKLDDNKEQDKTEDIFSDYYAQAESLLNTLTIDNKISQLLLVRHPSSNDLEIQKEYQFGGYVFFGSDFKNKTKEEVIKMITDLQNVSNIPLITAIDEEGGTVSRISSNKNLVDTPFLSPQDLYKDGGFQKIYDDVIFKSSILDNLGLNLNFAPVVDVSTNVNDYMYKRSLGMDTEHTSIYAKTVIEASKKGNVSYTLKHFPGYGNNIDTHISSSIDKKSYEEIMKYDIPPFIEGIKAGAEAVMVSHNIVEAIDKENPASISLKVHELLLNELNFKGVIITDDISMGALNNIKDIEVTAIKAHNNFLITSDYQKSFNNIKEAYNNNIISEEEIDALVLKNLAWKYYKHLI